VPTSFANWLAALRADIDDAVAYLAKHPKGLTGFQANALGLHLFPRIELRLRQVKNYAEKDPALEGPLGVLQALRDGLWALLAPWWDPTRIAEAEHDLIYGKPGAPQPAGILTMPAEKPRQDLRLAAQRALIRNHFGLTPRPAPVKHQRSHTSAADLVQ